MDNIKDSFNIMYPKIYAGSGCTKLKFHCGLPNISALYQIETKADERRCFITDVTVAALPVMKSFISEFSNGKRKNDILIILESGEEYKTIESVLRIVKAALDADFSRKDLFVAIGGGVICDLAGFASSIFKRGALVDFIPTTLLAMTDAAVGGKTGCDFDSYKNMIGSFFPARQINFYPEFIRFLPAQQYLSGLAEALKTALLYDKDLFEIFKNKKTQIIAREEDTVFTIIKKCAWAKALVVEKDFTESNIRMYLNLGHTFAHALETEAGLGAITHGDAVAWGIGRALELSFCCGFCEESYKLEIFDLLKEYSWETSAFHPQMKNPKEIVRIMHKDKKNKNNKIKFILQRKLNDTFIHEVEDNIVLNILQNA